MKQMKEVSQETQAVEDHNLCAASFLIKRRGVLADFRVDLVSRHEDVVVNATRSMSDFGDGGINVIDRHSLLLHLVGGDDIVISEQANLDITERTGLKISGIVRV